MDRLHQDSRTVERSPRDGTTASDCELLLAEWRSDPDAGDARMAQLARTIEVEIIPRLMLAHRAAPLPMPVGIGSEIGPEDVSRFAALVLGEDEEAAYGSVQALRARSVSVESIYMDLLAPTARHFGRLWEEDLCSFTDVTVGLGRLQRVLRELSPALGQGVAHADHGRRILLLPSPGEQHSFGLVMVAEFFRQAGWDVVGGAWAAGTDAAALVASEWFDAVGFSLGSEVHTQALTDSIAALRRTTRNRQLVVLVGGPLFTLDPSMEGRVGADGMTIDGRDAPFLAERLIASCVSEHPSRG